MSGNKFLSLGLLIGIIAFASLFKNRSKTIDQEPSSLAENFTTENPHLTQANTYLQALPTQEQLARPEDIPRANDYLARIQQIPSLANTEVNGKIQEDHHGQLIIDRDLRRIFDYFLSLRGRYSPEFIQDLFLSTIQDQVGQQAVEQAVLILQNYQAYLDESVNHLSKLNFNATETDFESLLSERQNIRRSYLGNEVAEAFYHDDERYEEHQLAALRISTASNLSETEKAALLEENDARLPAHLYRHRQKTFAYTQLETDLNAIQDTNEIYDIVAGRFGDEPAQRYIEALHAEKLWKQTVKKYFETKNAFMESYAIPSKEAQIEWQQHASKYYSSQDLARLQAIESEIHSTQ